MNKNWISVILVLVVIVSCIIALPRFLNKKKDSNYGDLGYINYGNINNQGMVQENGDWIYFINPEKNQNQLFKMKSDGSNLTKLNEFSTTQLLANNNFLYYYRSTSGDSLSTTNLYKLSLTDDTETMIKPVITGGSASQYVIDKNYLYYVGTDGLLYKAGLEGENILKICNEKVGKSFCIDNDWIYFINSNGTDSLYRVKIDGSGLSRIGVLDTIFELVSYQGEIYILNTFQELYKMDLNGADKFISGDVNDSINIKGNWFYFRSSEDNNFIYKMDLNGQSKQKVNDEFSSLINISGDWIYYVNENKELIRMKDDGTGQQNISKKIRDLGEQKKQQDNKVVINQENTEISLTELNRLYQEDPTKADQQFKGKALIIAGKLYFNDFNQTEFKDSHIWLKEEISFGCCFFDALTFRELKRNVECDWKTVKNVKIKGVCQGYTPTKNNGYITFTSCNFNSLSDNQEAETIKHLTVKELLDFYKKGDMNNKESVGKVMYIKGRMGVLDTTIPRNEDNRLIALYDAESLDVNSIIVLCNFNKTAFDELKSKAKDTNNYDVTLVGVFNATVQPNKITFSNCQILSVSEPK